MNPMLFRRVLHAGLTKAPTVPVEVQTLTNAWALTSAFVVGLQMSNSVACSAWLVSEVRSHVPKAVGQVFVPRSCQNVAALGTCCSASLFSITACNGLTRYRSMRHQAKFNQHRPQTSIRIFVVPTHGGGMMMLAMVTAKLTQVVSLAVGFYRLSSSLAVPSFMFLPHS